MYVFTGTTISDCLNVAPRTRGVCLFLTHLLRVIVKRGPVRRGQLIARSGVGGGVEHLHIAAKPLRRLHPVVRCRQRTTCG